MAGADLDKQPDSVSSVLKVFGILQALGEEREIGITELSQRVMMSKSTVYRFLQTMKSLGYVAQEGESEKYSLTLNPGILNLASLAVSVALLLVGLLLWFFVNRASSRANEQIELLQALLDQQKRQNALLRRLCEANAPEKEDVAEPTVAGKAKGEDEFIRLVAER
ncbi:TPA: helix-turn-helix domain-containing protein [Klebsiella pneumoniae]|nr:helix-turn-helix domain-containing protein [Klebsiella pneumoniae]